MSSSTTTSSSQRLSAIDFLQLLGKRFRRRSQNEMSYNSEEDLRSSNSIDSIPSSLDQENDNLRQSNVDLSCDASSESSSLKSSDHGLNNRTQNRRRRLLLAVIGKSLQNLTPSSRSVSCCSTPMKISKSDQQKLKVPKPQKPKPQPQRILRQPVDYVYLKGMSGLPTRRVPRSQLCCNNNCRQMR